MKHSNSYYVENQDYSKVLEKQPIENFKKYADFIRRYSDEGSSVLDVGCGTGIALSLLKESNRKLYGVDLSAPSIEIAKRKGLDNVRQYDGGQLPFDDKVLDVVGSFDVFEHVERPEYFLTEKLRVLKPGGVLILVCPNFLSITNSYHHHTAGVANKIRNVFQTFQKLLSGNFAFEKMETVQREVFQSDDDACNVTNPIDILKFAKSKGLEMIYWSSCSHYSQGLKAKLDFWPLNYFLGSSFFVFRKPNE